MTPSYDHIAPLQAAELPNAEIAEALSLMLAAAVPAQELENYFDARNLAERGLTGWEGPLIDAIGNEAMPAELRTGLSDLFKHLNKPRATQIDTHTPDYGVASHRLMAGLVAVGLITEDDHAAFDLLGGGHLYPEGVSEQEVADAIAAHEAAEAAAALQTATLQLVDEGYHRARVAVIDGGESDWQTIAAAFSTQPEPEPGGEE